MTDPLNDALTPSFFDDGDFPVDQRKCRLLGPTALVVQALMGVFVILSLVLKRHREKPKRQWKIWTFDISKQIVGQMFVHGVNVLISDLGAHHASRNPCALYFLNILIDTTLGVGIIYFIHRLLTHAFTDMLHLKGFESGQYGDPPSVWYWGRQAAIYVVSLTTMKLLVIGLFAVWPGIFELGDWLLGWTGGRDAMQVIFVMGFFPIVMNVLQFWLIDSIVKASTSQDALRVMHSPRQSADREPLFSASGSDNEDGGEDGGQTHGHDVENPMPSRSHPETISSRKTSGEEQKYFSSRASSDENEDYENTHAYPPVPSSHSKSSSISSQECSPPRSSVSESYRRKRLPPPPLQLRPLPKAIDFSGAHVIAVTGTPPVIQKTARSASPNPSLLNEKSSQRDDRGD